MNGERWERVRLVGAGLCKEEEGGGWSNKCIRVAGNWAGRVNE